MLEDNSRRYMTFAAPTIISCKYYYILLLGRRTIEISIQDGGLIKGQKTPITTPPYQVPSVDITPDPPIFSLVTTFKRGKMVNAIVWRSWKLSAT
jgi:hypothetical protein